MTRKQCKRTGRASENLPSVPILLQLLGVDPVRLPRLSAWIGTDRQGYERKEGRKPAGWNFRRTADAVGLVTELDWFRALCDEM